MAWSARSDGRSDPQMPGMTAFGAGAGDDLWNEGQQHVSVLLSRWRAAPAVAPLLEDLHRFGKGHALEALPALARAFRETPGGKGTDFDAAVGDLVQALVAGLAVWPLAQVPLRHSHAAAAGSLVLASSGRASLALAVWDGDAGPDPDFGSDFGPDSGKLRAAEFAPVESWLRVLRGSARAERIVRRAQGVGGGILCEPLVLTAGMVLPHCGLREAVHVQGPLVALRLQRALVGDEPVQVRAVGDGGTVRRTAPCAEQSRLELAMAAITAMERRDAIPALSRIAGGNGPKALRWAALKAALGLDTRAGMVLLGALASSDDDALSVPARRLHGQLLGAWPELERVAQWRG